MRIIQFAECIQDVELDEYNFIKGTMYVIKFQGDFALVGTNNKTYATFGRMAAHGFFKMDEIVRHDICVHQDQCMHADF